MDDDKAKAAATARKTRETLRVHNALTRTKLRRVEKQCGVLLTALGNIAGGSLPEGFRPEDRIALPDEDEDTKDRQALDCVQDYALFILSSGGGNPDRLAVVGYAQDSKVYCLDCSKQRKGSLEPVYSGVDLVPCAGCKAGLHVE